MHVAKSFTLIRISHLFRSASCDPAVLSLSCLCSLSSFRHLLSLCSSLGISASIIIFCNINLRLRCSRVLILGNVLSQAVIAPSRTTQGLHSTRLWYIQTMSMSHHQIPLTWLLHPPQNHRKAQTHLVNIVLQLKMLRTRTMS